MDYKGLGDVHQFMIEQGFELETCDKLMQDFIRMDIVNIALLRKCVGSTNIIKTICDTPGKQFAIEMFLA